MKIFTRPGARIIFGIFCGMALVPVYGGTAAISLTEIQKMSDAKVEQLKQVIRQSLKDHPGDRRKAYQAAARTLQMEPAKTGAYGNSMARMRSEQHNAYPHKDKTIEQELRKRARQIFPEGRQPIADNRSTLRERVAQLSGYRQKIDQQNQYVYDEFKKYQQEKAECRKKIYKSYEPELKFNMGYIYRYNQWLTGRRMFRTILYHTDKIAESVAEARKLSDYPKIAEILQSTIKQYPDGLNLGEVQQFLHDKKRPYDTASLQRVMDQAAQAPHNWKMLMELENTYKTCTDANNRTAAENFIAQYRANAIAATRSDIQLRMANYQSMNESQQRSTLQMLLQTYPGHPDTEPYRQQYRDLEYQVTVRQQAKQDAEEISNVIAQAKASRSYKEALNLLDTILEKWQNRHNPPKQYLQANQLLERYSSEYIARLREYGGREKCQHCQGIMGFSGFYTQSFCPYCKGRGVFDTADQKQPE